VHGGVHAGVIARVQIHRRPSFRAQLDYRARERARARATYLCPRRNWTARRPTRPHAIRPRASGRLSRRARLSRARGATDRRFASWPPPSRGSARPGVTVDRQQHCRGCRENFAGGQAALLRHGTRLRDRVGYTARCPIIGAARTCFFASCRCSCSSQEAWKNADTGLGHGRGHGHGPSRGYAPIGDSERVAALGARAQARIVGTTIRGPGPTSSAIRP
jgi:hypothetical protein